MPLVRPGSLLICVYYRVAEDAAPRAIAHVREFQRTLADRFGELEPQVLLRCGLPSADPSPDAPSTPSSSPPGLQAMPAVDRRAELTVMETYTLIRPGAGDPDRTSNANVADRREDPPVLALLAALDASRQPIAALLLGERHVELFAPCAS